MFVTLGVVGIHAVGFNRDIDFIGGGIVCIEGK